MSNNTMHMLYTKWAVQHLTTIDNCIERITKYSNVNMLDVVQALYDERRKLIENNPAYKDADEILVLIADAR